MTDGSIHLSYGVYVLTTLDRDRPVGCIIDSAMMVASNPRTIEVSIHHDNYTHDCLVTSGKFALSILSEKTPPTLIGIFGFHSSRDTNKFTDVPQEFKEGLPVIKDCFGYAICKVMGALETATHTVFLGEVVEYGDLDTSSPPMTYEYFQKFYHGKSPKNAPTYISLKKAAEAGRKTKWVCQACGHVYEGEELPEGYVCPICGAPASDYE